MSCYASHVFSARVNNTVTNVDANHPVTAKAIALYNPTAAVAFLQMFTRPASAVTLGTTPPTVVLAIPAGGAIVLPFSAGWRMGGSGLSIAGTTTRTGTTGADIDVVIVY
jgi:hypothetical protein